MYTRSVALYCIHSSNHSSFLSHIVCLECKYSRWVILYALVWSVDRISITVPEYTIFHGDDHEEDCFEICAPLKSLRRLDLYLPLWFFLELTFCSWRWASTCHAAAPDFAEVYKFIGSVFDPGVSGHLRMLKEMSPIDRETVSWCQISVTLLWARYTGQCRVHYRLGCIFRIFLKVTEFVTLTYVCSIEEQHIWSI